MHAVVRSSVLSMCLTAFTKLRNIGRHFSGLRLQITSPIESTSGFFALRALRPQPKIPFQPNMIKGQNCFSNNFQRLSQ